MFLLPVQISINFICSPIRVHCSPPPLCRLQDNAYQLKQETNDLQQQLLAERVRTIEFAFICVCVARLIFDFCIKEMPCCGLCTNQRFARCVTILLLFYFQTNVSELKQQMANLHEQMMEKQVCDDCAIFLHVFISVWIS